MTIKEHFDGIFLDEVYLRFDDNTSVAQKRVAAVNNLFGYSQVLAAMRDNLDGGDQSLSEDDDDEIISKWSKSLREGPAPVPLTEDEIERRLELNSALIEFFMGTGFRTLYSKAPTDMDSLTAAMAALSLSPSQSVDKRTSLPWLETHPFQSVDKCTSLLRPKARERFCTYLSHTCHRLIAVAGFAGSGKTTVLASCAVLFAQQPDISSVYVSAPTHVAVSNIAARIKAVSNQLGFDYIIIRGFKMEVELRRFVSTVQGLPVLEDKWRPARWHHEMSLCSWLVDFVRASKPHPKLAKLHKEYSTSEVFSELRLLVGGTPFEACHPAGSTKPPLMAVVKNIATRLVGLADFICTTPYASTEPPYRKACAAAGAVILDEAGALTKQDALMVWGPYMRPCAMAGDDKQLCPPAMERNSEFWDEAKTSVLTHHQLSGQGTFVLTEQLRIARGGFDLALQAVYPDTDDFAYGECCDGNEMAMAIERWARKRGLRGKPGLALPVFVNCLDTGCLTTESLSRINPQQNAHALDVIRRLLAEVSGVTPTDFTVITPYRANCAEVKRALAAAGLSAIQVQTADSFQGQETQIVVVIMATDAASGPLFTGIMYRLCVSTTRHTAALIIVGDINTVSFRATHANEVCMATMFKYMSDNGRVMHVGGEIGRLPHRK